MSQKAETKIPDTTQTDAEIAVAKAQAIAIEKANAVSTEKSSTNPVALKCAEMDLLNELLALIPMNVLRMKSSYKTAAGILKTVKSRTNAISKEIKAKLDSTPETKAMDTLTHNEIIAYRNKLLKPVEKFFGDLYSHQRLLKPLIVKILIGDEEIKNIDTKKYLFLQFFNVTKTKASTFFLDTLVTEQKLIQACEEFEVLFGVVTTSLSDNVIQKEQELINLIKSKRKK